MIAALLPYLTEEQREQLNLVLDRLLSGPGDAAGAVNHVIGQLGSTSEAGGSGAAMETAPEPGQVLQQVARVETDPESDLWDFLFNFSTAGGADAAGEAGGAGAVGEAGGADAAGEAGGEEHGHSGTCTHTICLFALRADSVRYVLAHTQYVCLLCVPIAFAMYLHTHTAGAAGAAGIPVGGECHAYFCLLCVLIAFTMYLHTHAQHVCLLCVLIALAMYSGAAGGAGAAGGECHAYFCLLCISIAFAMYSHSHSINTFVWIYLVLWLVRS